MKKWYSRIPLRRHCGGLYAGQTKNADQLGSILAYLKSCAATSVLQARRKAEKSSWSRWWDDTVAEHEAPTTQAQIGSEVGITTNQR